MKFPVPGHSAASELVTSPPSDRERDSISLLQPEGYRSPWNPAAEGTVFRVMLRLRILTDVAPNQLHGTRTNYRQLVAFLIKLHV